MNKYLAVIRIEWDRQNVSFIPCVLLNQWSTGILMYLLIEQNVL